MEYLGIDVHKVESQICILTESGEVVERRIRTQRERFAAVLGERPRPASWERIAQRIGPRTDSDTCGRSSRCGRRWCRRERATSR